jgi:hypothetical protein
MKKRAPEVPKRIPPEKRPRPYLLVSQRCFEDYFWLAGPGRLIALDALAAGIISTSYEAVDTLCLATMLHADAVHDLITADMAARGHTIDYKKAKTQTEVGRLTGEAVEVLGDDRFRAILREAEDIVRENLGIPKTNSEWLPWFLTVPVN